MTAITRYILRQLVAVTVIVALTLICAIWLTQSLRFLELIVTRGLQVSTFVYLTMLLLPSFLNVILPIALFTAVMFTYNRLSTDSELVVLKSLGLGPGTLALPALMVAAAIVAVGYALTLYFLPLSYRAFKDLEYNIRSDYTTILLREGAFNTVSDGITVYIRSREVTGEMFGLIVHDNRQRERPITLLAERGTLAFTEDGPRVIMVNGNRQQVERGTGKLSLLYFDRYSVELGRLAEKQENRWRDPRERFMHELWNIDESPIDRQFTGRLRAEFHNRLVAPLYAFAFALIGLAALMSGDFNRRGQNKKILVTIALVVVLQAGAIALNNVVARTPSLFPLAYLFVLGAIAVAGWWLWRPPSRRRMAAAWLPAR